MIRISCFGAHRTDWRDDYLERTKRLIPFQWTDIKLSKLPDHRPEKLLVEEQKFLKEFSDFILLDSRGTLVKQNEFDQLLFRGDVHLVIGPSFGFHPDFYTRAKKMISFSNLTFTHALAQTMCAESIYRAACTLKNHPFVK